MVDSTKCYNCGSPMRESVELILSNGRTVPQNVLKCSKCGKAIVAAAEYERVRREVNPGILARIKGLFRGNTPDLYNGKLL